MFVHYLLCSKMPTHQIRSIYRHEGDASIFNCRFIFHQLQHPLKVLAKFCIAAFILCGWLTVQLCKCTVARL